MAQEKIIQINFREKIKNSYENLFRFSEENWLQFSLR